MELLSLPARILTLGLFGLVINAVLLLLLALVSDTFSLGFKLATFPPHFSMDAFVAALLSRDRHQHRLDRCWPISCQIETSWRSRLRL